MNRCFSLTFSTILPGLAALACFALAPAAHADKKFTFSYEFPIFAGGSVLASGMLTTTDFDPVAGAYTILDIAGTRIYDGTTATITGLLPVNSFGFNDNLLYASSPFLDNSGLTFSLDNNSGDNGTNLVNMYYDGNAGGTTEYDNNIGYGDFFVTPQASAVPEPGSMAFLLGLSMTGAGFLARRKRRGK